MSTRRAVRTDRHHQGFIGAIIASRASTIGENTTAHIDSAGGHGEKLPVKGSARKEKSPQEDQADQPVSHKDWIRVIGVWDAVNIGFIGSNEELDLMAARLARHFWDDKARGSPR